MTAPTNPPRPTGRALYLALALSLPGAALVLPSYGKDGPVVDRKPVSSAPIDFNRQIRPILSDNCFRCHGPDKEERKAKLRLDSREGALKALRGGGHAIVPGHSAKSALIERITSADPRECMPPPKTNKRLTAQQIDLLRRW